VTVVGQSEDLGRRAADAIFSKKGTDIVLLDVEDLFVLTDIFVIATGTSRPHVQTLAEVVEERFREDLGIKPIRSEGQAEAEWILLDFGDIIVHLFQSEAREYYGLERLWADAAKVEWNEPAVSETLSDGN
jgi:ribosome-associated protein